MQCGTLLIDHHWVVADSPRCPTTPASSATRSPVSFDSSLPEYTRVFIHGLGPSGLETEFTGGGSRKIALLLSRSCLCLPGSYCTLLAYVYHTSDITCSHRTSNGEIIDAKSNTVLAESPDLSSDEMKHETLIFREFHLDVFAAAAATCLPPYTGDDPDFGHAGCAIQPRFRQVGYPNHDLFILLW